MTRTLALVVLLSGSTIVAAAPGLDLVILVDRSTSMARHPRLDTLLLRMTLDLAARNGVANRAEHRLAVIGFGASATVEVPFVTVRPADLPRIRLSVDALPNGDRGHTDVLTALVAAESLLRTLPADPERRRAIVLLTDGVPWVRGADMNAYLAELQQFTVTQLPRARITLDVLLVDQRHRDLWRELGAGVELASRRPHRFLPQAHGLIARLTGTRTTESAPAKTNPAVDTLVVPPYLDVIVFDIFRPSSATQVELIPPAHSAPIRPGVGGVESLLLGDVLATLVVPRPAPGEWTIRKSHADAGVRILSQQFFPRGLLLRPGERETVRRCDSVPLAYRVLDGSGNPLDELRDYALAVEVALALPDGTKTSLALERDPSFGAAAFRAPQNVVCNLAGRYWTDVKIRSVDAKGRSLDVFRDRWSGFAVTAADCTRRPVVSPVRENPPNPVTQRSGNAMIVLLVMAAFSVLAFLLQKTKS